MKLESISCYLIHPGKNIENPTAIEGSSIPAVGSLYEMLGEVFENADTECRIPIRFLMDEEGRKNNAVRNELIQYLQNPGTASGFELARRLQEKTTKTPGLCLLFLLYGREGSKRKMVLSRFPADQGIVAERRDGVLELAFLERVFIKSERRYKAVLYRGTSLENHFWEGMAIDKQINEPNYQIANYWIKDFLASDYKTTSKAGTRRFAVALRNATRSAEDLEVKQEITAMSLLMPGMDQQVVTIEEILGKYGVSTDTREEILKHLQYVELAEDTFKFDKVEYAREVAYRVIELDTGAMISAPVESFDELVGRETIDAGEGRFRFTMGGKIVDERVRARR